MLEGVVNVLKPPGMTSSDVVADVRHIFGIKRVGHTGTLDPGAAGVLGICLGRATRLFDLLVDKQKEYICELAFGASTDTQDSYGHILETSAATVEQARLLEVLPRFTGKIEQLAPLYSAIKVDGKALYAHTRAGNVVEQRRRTATIYELALIRELAPNRFLLRILCGKGTYVRTLCSDIGEALGVPAHMAFLLRTRAGALGIEDAYTIDELRALKEADALQSAVLPPDAALPFIPELHLAPNEQERRFLLHGAQIQAPEGAAEGLVRLYLEQGFIGLGEIEKGVLHLSLSFVAEAAE